MKTVVTRLEAGAKFKLMALDDEDLQPLWLELGESVSSDSILAVEFYATSTATASGTTFFYLERAPYRFYPGASPEHHRASLDSWRRIWDWK